MTHSCLVAHPGDMKLHLVHSGLVKPHFLMLSLLMVNCISVAFLVIAVCTMASSFKWL
ncbi:unnamed protein product, partial [Candidula unifasciata]